MKKPRKPLHAALMSFVMPGFGQFYNGEANKAIWLFLGFAFLALPGVALVALYLPGSLMMPALFVSLALTLFIWIYAMVDAWRGARVRQDYVPQAWQMSGIYMLLLILGDIFLLPMLTSYVREHQVESFRIPSNSMEPSVLRGDIIFADKRYNCPECKHAIRRGDIAIFIYPNDRTFHYIKRIIGLPGDRIQVKGSEIWLNGKALQVANMPTRSGILATESIDGRQWQVQWSAGEHTQAADFTVPPGQVFVMGDNRDSSKDSRLFGTVPMPDVVGRARQVWFSRGEGGVRWNRFGKVLL